MTSFAFGNPHARVHVYVEKAPPVENVFGHADDLPLYTSLQKGHIKALGEAGGNGWRKVFNVYAKLMFALPESSPFYPHGYKTWQAFRDQALLQAESNTALHFGHANPLRSAQTQHSDPKHLALHIIAGRTHAHKLGLSGSCVWINNEFAKHPTLPILICPYFDYRQLSNSKIDVLTKLMAINDCNE
ncbi:DUF6942 family protein [Enterovibrio norvegicus]|uniref:DUF6942 family protein n=1 Tax=Enterovibrio norvegicus TaxID=188144 RepID=UPI0013D23F29|nr:hypothetical protein [Enterovibrio norvegicus]